MALEDTIRRIKDIGIVPVVRAAHLDEARQVIDAIRTGGVPIIEVTMTVPNAPAMIRELVQQYGDQILTGAGTVTSAQQAEVCLESGAQFLVSPGLSLAVLQVAAKQGILAIPGALTPTEVMAALDAGARVVKIFPCASAGGPKHLKALRAPFPDTPFIPTGGVNLSNAAEYLAAGAFALGVGGELVDLAALRRNEREKIVEMSKSLIETVRLARSKPA